MSHFDDDVAVIFIGGPIGLIITIIVLIIDCNADKASADVCAQHGEKYVDSRSAYTLCEQDGGTVVRR